MQELGAFQMISISTPTWTAGRNLNPLRSAPTGQNQPILEPESRSLD